MSTEDNEAKRWLREMMDAAGKDFINRCMGVDPRLIGIADWEIQWLRHATNEHWIALQGSFIHAPPEKRLSLFTLNREYITHLAAYAEIRASCAPGERVEIEYRNLDLVVFSGEHAKIGIEVKKSSKEAENLISGMLKVLPSPALEGSDRGNDPLRKIKCLLEIRPEEFWVICPDRRWKFRMDYIGSGFELTPIESKSDVEKMVA